MKLQQGQIWEKGGEYLRIVRLGRREVDYKSQLDPTTRDGTHHQLGKKEFCRLLNGATLQSPLPKAPGSAATTTATPGPAH